MIDLMHKGRFEPINTNFITDSKLGLNKLADVQKKYNKNDMDTLLNELHDSIVGYYLGFKLINVEKHGFDCKLNEQEDIFLESKAASLDSSSWSATFNDTTYEKAELFKDPRVYLALSLWENASNLTCICFGRNNNIGDYLKLGVDKHKDGKTVRSTQTISFSKLVFEYKFKIMSISMNVNDLIQLLQTKNKSFKKLSSEDIILYSSTPSNFSLLVEELNLY